MKTEQKSLTGEFFAVDNYIQQNKIDKALGELEKSEKNASDALSYLGIYKRYLMLNEKQKAENILVKGVKANPKNNEINAVYAKFLVDNNRINEAEKYGKRLDGTEYSSVYSEIILKKSLNVSTKEEFLDFYNIYYNAYLSSKNPVWIRNCAILDLKNGRYDRVIDLVPDTFSDVDDAYFWALALYDSGKYYEAIDILKKADELRENYHSFGSFKISEIEQTALLSDAYMAVSEIDKAESARQKVVLNIDNLTADGADNELLPVILTNSAIWANKQGYTDKCADLLFYIVNTWPDYVPGLVLYSDFAYNSNVQRQENKEMLALRESGLATVEMEKYDARRKIPVSDALYRVNASLQRTNDPYLSIVQLDLKYKSDKSLTVKEKNRDLWNMLEDSYNYSLEYKSLLIQYALHSLISTKQYDDAWDLFQTYVYSVFEYDKEKDFWSQFIQNIKQYDKGMVEFAAWFASNAELKQEALCLYEYCVLGKEPVFKTIDKKKSKNKKDTIKIIPSINDEQLFITADVSTKLYMNLANIYESVGEKRKALDLYGKLSGRESKNSLRSEIYYRIANIYTEMGDYKNALRSVEYAYELYPENIRASLLRDSLKI